MISCILKLIIFSIILGQLTLIYNNNCNRLYKNTNNGNIALIRTNFRSLAELSHKLTTNYMHENKELKEYRNTNDRKYKKDKYPKNDVKSKQNVLEVPKNENTRTPNSKKYKKAKYNKEKEAKSNIFARFLNYLETLRKLCSNFFVKKYNDFLNFLYKLSDKRDNSHESTNKKKSSDKLFLLNKANYKYLYYLKENCVPGTGICIFSSTVLVNCGIQAGISAAKTLIKNYFSLSLTEQVIKFLGINVFFESSVANVSATIQSFSTTGIPSISGAAFEAFGPYGIAALIIILIVVALIILCIYLRKRKKNSANTKERNIQVLNGIFRI
ncbi:stevor PIR protein,putative [Plasmodium sp.]|nr:stevor PIR protein,putative [Plasmodium sp.]